MSTALITYLHYHPKATPFSYFDIGSKAYYSEEEKKLGMQGLQKNEVEPLLMFLEQDKNHRLNVCLSIPVLEYLSEKTGLLARFKKLVKNGQLELLAGRGFNSFAILYSRRLFEQETHRQNQLFTGLFGRQPTGFLNTALLYSNSVGQVMDSLGYAYAIVPKISWYVRNSTTSLFKGQTGNLRLFMVDNTIAAESIYPAKINLLAPFDPKQVAGEKTLVLLASIKDDQELSDYSLPELVAYDTMAGGLEMIVGNNLQKDFLARLKELAGRVAQADDAVLTEDFLWLGSLMHFKALANTSENRYKMYTRFLTMLYDLEIKLR